MPSFHRARLRARRRHVCRMLPVLALALPAVFAASANAAAPTPEAATSCGGSLTRGTPNSTDQNPLNYKFNCDWGISSYTLLINRGDADDSTMDDFSTTALVTDGTGAIVSNASFGCEGTLPGNGVNCNAGAAGFMAAPDFAEGTFDTTDPYCSNIPSGSPAGTQPEPAALVQLIVTDTTGAEDGPFRLRLAGKCPAVHVTKPKDKAKCYRQRHCPRPRPRSRQSL